MNEIQYQLLAQKLLDNVLFSKCWEAVGTNEFNGLEIAINAMIECAGLEMLSRYPDKKEIEILQDYIEEELCRRAQR